MDAERVYLLDERVHLLFIGITVPQAAGAVAMAGKGLASCGTGTAFDGILSTLTSGVSVWFDADSMSVVAVGFC